MELNALDLKKLLPEFMREDKEMSALADALSRVFMDINADIKKLRTWDQIDNLTEQELDELADELYIIWYKKNYSIETKRQLIKDSDKAFMTLGTRAACEMVMSAIYDGTQLVEWFEYGGEPHHFRIECEDVTIFQSEIFDEFIKTLNLVKRKSQWLDHITVLFAKNTYYNTFTVLDNTTEEILVN